MNKILSKSGASDMVVVLIMIVIFAAVAFFVFNAIGGSVESAGNKTGDLIQNATDYSTGA